MNAIVRKTFPAAKLPPELREGIADDALVTVIVTVEDEATRQKTLLDHIWAMRQPPFRTGDDILDDLRRQRDAWDD